MPSASDLALVDALAPAAASSENIAPPTPSSAAKKRAKKNEKQQTQQQRLAELESDFNTQKAELEKQVRAAAAAAASELKQVERAVKAQALVTAAEDKLESLEAR